MMENQAPRQPYPLARCIATCFKRKVHNEVEALALSNSHSLENQSHINGSSKTIRSVKTRDYPGKKDHYTPI